ncbi:MAG: class I SAM-dependent methyltransferase [Opitutales bacterium]
MTVKKFIKKKLPPLFSLFEQMGLAGRLFLLKALPRKSVGVEVGVFQGDFSERILKIVQPKKLYLIDPWEFQEQEEVASSRKFGAATEGGHKTIEDRYQMVCERFRAEREDGQVEMIRKYSKEASTHFSPESIDWVYIDGNHLYEYVKEDLELFFPKVKPNGIIAGDDYHDKGWWKGGVKKAVDEFVQTGKVDVVKIAHGQFILRKRG